MESKLLESIFSDPISNNPSAILGCENITTKRVRGGTFRQETALSQESDDDDEESSGPEVLIPQLLMVYVSQQN